MAATIGGVPVGVYLNQQRAQQYLAQRQNNLAEERRLRSEEQFKIQQGLIGTDQQGQEGPSAEVLPYTSRYSFDPEAAGLRIRGGRTIGTAFLQQRTDAANTLLQQAEDAARAGDFDSAADLKEQARLSLTNDPGQYNRRGRARWNKGIFGHLTGMEGLEDIWSLDEDPRQAALSALQSPQAMTVGEQLREARAFQDWDSAESIEERRRLREPGERAIRASERDTLRTNRYQRLQSGQSQRAFGASQVNERVRESFSVQFAQLEADVASSFNEYRRQYATNAVSFAQSWAENTGGVREQFQSSLDALFTGMSQLAANFDQTAARNFQTGLNYSQYQQNRADVAEQQRQRMIQGATSQLLGGLVQGYLGGWSGAQSPGWLGGSTLVNHP